MRDMEKAYSFRFYPTPEQESLLRRTLGCVRLVYNKVTDGRVSKPDSLTAVHHRKVGNYIRIFA